MKKLGIILPFLLLYISALSQPKEFYHFKFIEPNRSLVNNTITHIISIDKVDHDTIYAYANKEEMLIFEKLGYKYSLIPQSSINAKSITMATSVDQMAGWNRYPTYSVYRAMMKKFEHDFPALCKLDSVGTTINGHKIYVIKLSKNVSLEEPEVEVFYTSTMHGDETTGFILMLRLIDYMLSNYSTNTRISSMLDNMAIYINPDANPDGTYYGGDNNVSGAMRYNANYIDINRNFPDPRLGYFTTIQTETQIMMNYASSRHFTLSANFHGGAELVNYPWDSWVSATRTHADNDWFIHVSRQFADSAHAVAPLGYLNQENNGITNGGDWYVVAGGRQDYMNWWHHCREITIELSDVKLLAVEQLNNLWNYNRAGLITFLQSATRGFKGIVTDVDGTPIKAKISISGHDTDSSHVYSNTTTGFYARPIEPGTWQVTYSAPGYISQTHTINIANWESSVVKDVQLLQKFDVTFDVKYLGSPIEGVNINFNGIDLQTLSNGKAIFQNFPQGKGYNYSVSFGGYHTTTGQVNVLNNRTISINLVPVATVVYTVSYAVVHQSQPIEDVTIAFNGVEQETSLTGIVSFVNTIQGTNIGYSLSKFGYQTFTGQTDVNDNKTINVDLIPCTYSLTFNIKHLGAAISDVNVNFIGVDLQTAPDGSVIFSNLTYGKDYSYTITKNGYKTVVGKADVTGNNTIDIELIPIFNVTFNISDQGVPVANAKVLFNSLLKSSAIDGVATFNDVLYGIGYDYIISLMDYNEVTGVVNVTENRNISIELTRVGVLSPFYQPNLLKVWPNPISKDINISFNLDKPSYISLTLYSIDGQMISLIAKGFYPKGVNTINSTFLEGVHIGSYVVVLRVGNKSYSQIIQHIR